MKTDDKAEVEEAKRPQQKRHRRRCLPISNVSYLWPARKFKCGRGPLSILQIHTETETQDAGAAFWMGREMCEFTMRSNAVRCSSWQESAGCDQMWEYVLPSLTASLSLSLFHSLSIFLYLVVIWINIPHGDNTWTNNVDYVQWPSKPTSHFTNPPPRPLFSVCRDSSLCECVSECVNECTSVRAYAHQCLLSCHSDRDSNTNTSGKISWEKQDITL